jgi:hypothetical protein
MHPVWEYSRWRHRIHPELLPPVQRPNSSPSPLSSSTYLGSAGTD